MMLGPIVSGLMTNTAAGVINRGGLGALSLGPIHYGARFSLGVELAEWWADTSFRELPDAMALIRQRLVQSGYVDSSTRVYQLSGYLNPFIVIEGGSGREYGSATHLKDAVLSIVETVAAIDAASVRFEAETYTPGAAPSVAPTVQRYDAISGGNNSAPPATPSGVAAFFDQVAGDLGITRGQAIGLGIGAGFVGLILLRRIL